nr:replication factor A protein 1-like [Ipomoea batatas]
MINGRPSRLIDFVIENLKGNQVKCTVWDDHVEKVKPFFKSDLLDLVVVLIQMGRIKLVEKCIESDPNDWYYDSCPKPNCNKKLELNSRMYDCGKCGGRFVKGTLRYKLKIRVVDVNGTTPLLLWDREVMTKVLKDIRNLKGRGLFFKISVKSETFDNLDNAVPHNNDEFSSKLQLTQDDSDSDEDEAGNETEVVKRSLLDEFSSTQPSKKKKDGVVKMENEKE